MTIEVHPTAIIEDGAEIGEGTTVGPYSIIRKNVRTGRRNVIGPHVVIEGFTTIGDENQIFQFASLGAVPQDLKYKGEPSELQIGSRNRIREFVTLQPGTEGGGMITSIGDQNLFMANSHVGHDTRIGNGNVLANSAGIAGHVEIGNRAILGGLCGIHQFVRLGDLCLVSAGAMVGQDVPPFCLVHGDRAKIAGLNAIGLDRAGFSREDIARLKRLFREVLGGKGLFKERLETAAETVRGFTPGEQMIQFLSSSSRGICSVHTKQAAD